jgi:hypothetical protein
MINYKFQINYKIKMKQKAGGKLVFVITTQLQLGCHLKI